MASIQTGIELNDQFTSVIYGIINAVNLAVSTMEDMQHAMNADMDTSGIEGVRDEINQAAMAMNELNQAMQNQPLISTDPFAQPTTPSPAEPQRTPEWSHAPPGMDVFTSSGVERFQQEVQSANAMLEQLSTTQDAIARQAYSTNLLPPEAFQDLSRLAVRIDMVRDRIQQIENNPLNVGTDTANAELEMLRSQLSQAVEEQNQLNQAMQDMDVSAANDAYLRLSQTVGNTERHIRDNVDEQGRFNQEINEGISQADDLMNTIKGVVGAYVSIQAVGDVLNISDELVQTTSRLNMMNDGLQTTGELVNMVYAAAQDARGSFGGMADVIARFGSNAGDAFSSTAEVVAFANLVQKQMTIAGASTTEASNAMLQLSQGLGSGVLRGDELNSIFEQAPNLIQNIADYLEVPIGTIRQMASEGELTADIVKAAIFSASDEINANFEQMPMTWGQIWQSMQNTAMIAFQPVLQRLNDLANSDAFQSFVNGAIEALATLANIALEVFDFMASCGQLVADNWSVISPIIWGIVAALAAYGAYLAITKGLELASAAASGAMAVAKGLQAAAMVLFTGATWAGASAQLGLNAAMYACPVVWIVMLIIALIAVIFAACNAIAELTGIASSGFGVICGVAAAAAALIGNIVIGLINTAITWCVSFYNLVANFAAAFGVLFDNPAAAIKATILSLFNFIVGVVTRAASLLDAVFGSNLADAVSAFQGKIQAEIDATVEGAGGNAAKPLDPSAYTLDRIGYGDAFDAGASWGDGVAAAVGSLSLSDALGMGGMPSADDYAYALDGSGVGSGIGDISENTGSIADSMEITEEDLKYLRDIAEQETVNRFTTAEIRIEQTNNNNVSGGMDLDGVVSGLTDAVNEAVDIITEGVHE